MKLFDIHRISKVGLLAVAILFFELNISAQTSDFQRRYDLLVSRVGHSGLGVETLIKEWEKCDSTNVRMLVAKFDYYFSKSQKEVVVTKTKSKYLGMDPLLSLQDSLGNKVYYFREMIYDDEPFSQALKTAERLSSLYPDDLDHRFMKANALIAYEKENPDMAYAYLKELVELDQIRLRPWNYEGRKQKPGFFPDAIQEYCREFYAVSSQASMKVFHDLSLYMSTLYPQETCFLSNVATYYLVALDNPKAALKYYGKVLKKNKSDEVALRNSVVAARKLGNKKLETKCRQALIDNGYIK